MLEVLKSKLNSLKVDENTAWFAVVNREVQFEIIRLNTEDQLFDEGIDSLSNSLFSKKHNSGVYSERTQQLSNGVKQAGAHYTLKDTGNFYQSFVVKVDTSGINIVADTQKDDTDLSIEYGKEILGLTEGNTGLLRDMIIINYREFLRDKIAS